MSWILKNWYVIVIVAAIAIWLIVDPSVDKADQNGEEIMINETPASATVSEGKSKPSTEVMVDIKGEVQQPGVYVMDEDDRVQDVVQKAGGFTNKANQQLINLAERVYDEMIVQVPDKNTSDNVSMELGVASEDNEAKIRINIADATEIQTIPGIGEVKAQAIIEYRETNGRFKTPEELTKVTGIGEKTLENMKEFILVP
ncbi:helix-hairpin-helix domain-containing protein [Gracilibacillus caseinilyticus]|uniref:Helix-hairpin-helix domain-containing protein n=1 Tax=Gracilibacillus caseinilyticus TaxID=2932256 RepID=A0ABY4ETT8_9BACI|nr:helix-hairpin-helix domain-containing protein [Gracilibacillus caseinilyticus]UOQ47390.1 helix-hairpin-helix domain-containing protein [Gracilibacillus caseinilyticus]